MSGSEHVCMCSLIWMFQSNQFNRKLTFYTNCSLSNGSNYMKLLIPSKIFSIRGQYEQHVSAKPFICLTAALNTWIHHCPGYENETLKITYRKHILRGPVAQKNISLKFGCLFKMYFPFSLCSIHKCRPLNSAEPGGDVMERFLFLLPSPSLFIHRPCIFIWQRNWRGKGKRFPAGLSSDRRAMCARGSAGGGVWWEGTD